MFHFRKPLPPRIDPCTLKRAVPAQPVPVNATSYAASWIWGGAPLTGAQLDAMGESTRTTFMNKLEYRHKGISQRDGEAPFNQSLSVHFNDHSRRTESPPCAKTTSSAQAASDKLG